MRCTSLPRWSGLSLTAVSNTSSHERPRNAGSVLEREQVRELDEDLVAEVGAVERRAALVVVTEEERAARGEVVGYQSVHVHFVAVLIVAVLREDAGAQL